MRYRLRLASPNNLVFHLNDPHVEHQEGGGAGAGCQVAMVYPDAEHPKGVEPRSEHQQGAIAVLVLGAGGRFWITECQHANNRECDRRVRERIVELLEDAGVPAGLRQFSAAMEPFTNATDIPEYAYQL